MKKLMIAALAVASCSAFAEFDTKAKAEGFYDVQLTTKRLAHVEKSVSKTFTDKKSGGKVTKSAEEQFAEYLDSRIVKKYDEPVTNLAGYTVLSYDDSKPGKIAFKFKYFDLTVANDGTPTWKSKVVSETWKGLYDATGDETKGDGKGKVYLWSAASADKIKKTKNPDDPYDIIQPKPNDKADKNYSGYVAYEVPLAMHGEFERTHDDKVAGGFLGETAKAANGAILDFKGLTAFGTGTKDKDDKGGLIKTVSGNVAAKYDTKNNGFLVGSYGTWKINRITSSTFPTDLREALVKKGCVELINELVAND